MKVKDWPLYHYVGEVFSITDGDTIRVNLDLGDGVSRLKRRIRLYGVDTEELDGPNYREALEAKMFLSELFVADKRIFLRTIKDAESLSRLIGRVNIEQKGELVSVSGLLVEENRRRIEAGEKPFIKSPPSPDHMEVS